MNVSEQHVQENPCKRKDMIQQLIPILITNFALCHSALLFFVHSKFCRSSNYITFYSYLYVFFLYSSLLLSTTSLLSSIQSSSSSSNVQCRCVTLG